MLVLFSPIPDCSPEDSLYTAHISLQTAQLCLADSYNLTFRLNTTGFSCFFFFVLAQ